jgi:hypothetical protein
MTNTALYPIFIRQGKSKTRFKVGYINHTGKGAIDPIFDYGTRFYEGLAAVEVRGRWGVIDASGEFVIQPKPWSHLRFRDGLASVSVKDKWEIVDRTGSFLLQPKYDYLGPLREGFALFKVGEFRVPGRYGFVDQKGVELTPAVFHNAYGFSEGLAAAKVGNPWGYIDPSGVFKITPRFEGTRPGAAPDRRHKSWLLREWSGSRLVRPKLRIHRHHRQVCDRQWLR